ncbi:DUF3971 domain-containing protein [Methylobacterium organophilum]|uniref:YhdP central domain-containing protein n=1 Tax=Methylobacterium organophilum TaxID=410 RepID=A0ABQ4T971_METOR|nr:DUF3971 domain-containing protein [Methylobacterium organophilum]GJE28216.1 hypothetical protein LKMONMHP_3083 [Methylobacterium organophilum]
MDQETARTLLREAVAGPCTPTAPEPSRRRRRPVLWCTLAFTLLLCLTLLGTAWAVLRLTQGPLRIDGMSAQVASAIAGSIGPNWKVELRDSALELDAEDSLALRVAGLDVYNPEGALVVRAPLAVVSLDTWSLLRLSVQPRSIEFRDLQMTALVHNDGSIAFAASSPSQEGAAKPHTLPSVDAARGTVSPISAAAASIFGVVLDSAGVIGALDRARITNGRLTLIDDDARTRAVFEHVNGLFHRDAAQDARLFELRIDGPHGEWRFGGTLHEGSNGHRTGTITLDDLPVMDMLLLSGQSKLPIVTDLKLSAEADVALTAGRIDTMTADVRTSDGNLLIEEKDFNPVTIESVTARMSWDETHRAVQLDGLDYLGAGNRAHLTGNFAMNPPGSPTAWTFTFSGRDAILRGAAKQDAPVKIAEIDGRLVGWAGGVGIDELNLKGDLFSGRLSGSVGAARDDGGLTLHIEAGDTDTRAALRLWPENIAPPVRNYLVDYLRGGHVEAADIVVDMSGAELAAATRGDPMPDKAIHIAFTLSDAGLLISPDAPPLSRGQVAGVITGRGTTVEGATAELRMADNRTMFLTEGSFVIRDPKPEDITAQIGFRLTGGGDALAALLQTKMFHGLTGTDIDPATIKGRVDLRIDFPLNLKNPGDLVDIPIVLTGTLSDFAMDRIVGKDRFENGRFALSYDRSGFSLKGDGRMLGAPVTVDLKQAKPGAPGEAVVGVIVDDGFRAKKGLPSAPQLAGTIPLRFVVPIGRAGSGKPPIKVEADLMKASIDGLLPGWSKAAGKPGRLSLTLLDTGSAMELRDIVLEAAPALARGSATVSTENGFERADLTALKLSPGDDMRASLDRIAGGYKVVVKGAVGDARPFLRALTSTDGKGSKDPAPKDIEAEVSLNVLAGFNNENLTNASLQLKTRGSDVRSAQFRGKFGAAPVSATVAKGAGGVPMLSLDSSDAGSTLRFLDIYKRMYGGRVLLNIALGDGPQQGVVQIKDFALRNEPALSSIMAQGPETSEYVDAKGRRHVVQGQGSEVVFDRMRANFTRSGSRMTFTDAAISNAAMGFTLGGWLDTDKGRTEINGTFVPLYGLNNVVAQVPLVGPLLAGGHNEGLFAINFNVSGPIAKPNVNVNPLSAVAPGFLRKLFGAGGGDAYANGLPEPPPSDR